MMKNECDANQKLYWARESLNKRRLPTHPVVAAYVLPKINAIKCYIDFSPKTRFLDVGCGNGFFTYYFDQMCDVFGIDYSEKMLELNPVKKTKQMSAEKLEFDDNTFDVVFCHALLHHVDNIDKVISEMKRVSKRNIIILEPNRNNPFMFLFSMLIKEERKALKFSLSYLENVVKKEGLRIIDSFSYGMIVPNKIPTLFLPLVNLFNFKQSLGITNFIIAEKID
jgi:ubiquinone/menaquinone biosynthesis C-methylase UbiE